MATNSSATVDIAVYVSLDKRDAKNILSFIVQDECHLKKLAIGAYSLNILDTQLLKSLGEYECTTVTCGEYLVSYNINEAGGINAILFNKSPAKLKKGACVFKIVCEQRKRSTNDHGANSKTPTVTQISPEPYRTAPVAGHHRISANSNVSSTISVKPVSSPANLDIDDDNARSSLLGDEENADDGHEPADRAAHQQQLPAGGHNTDADGSDTDTADSVVSDAKSGGARSDDDDDDDDGGASSAKKRKSGETD